MRHLNSIKTFLLVAQDGSFSKAARRLNISAATASAYLDTLEAHLGGKLFIRSTRQLVLTDLGRLYLDLVQPLVDKLEQANQLALEFNESPQGVLKVSLSTRIDPTKIANAIAQFTERHPEMHVLFSMDNGGQPPINDSFHVAIRTEMDEERNGDLIQRKLIACRPVLVASPDYLDRAPPLRSPDDLENHNILLHLPRDEPTGTMLFRIDGELRTVEVKGRLSSNYGEMSTIWAMRGRGVAQKPFWEVADAIETGALVRLLEDYEPGELNMHAISPFRPGESLKVDRFISFLRKELGSICAAA